jgi:predicted dehydrogenase
MLGDWGCHTFDTPVWALDLDPPTVVECVERRESLDGVVPAGSWIRFEFPANDRRGPVTLDWFDGPQDWSKVGRIEKFGADHAAHLGRACWMVGSKGMIGCGTHAGPPTIEPVELRKQWQAAPPPESIPRVVGGPFREWLRAIKGEGPEPGSNFRYAARLTEIILLGVLAQRFNTRIEWDAAEGRITNHPELNAFVRQPARDGWRYGETLS